MTLSNLPNSTHRSIKCTVPSKLILSGEHAVLYHCPALSMAIDLPTVCTLTQQTTSTPQFNIHLKDFDLKQRFSFDEWQQQAQQIEHRFKQFENHALEIDAVLSSPFDLILISLWVFHQHKPIQAADWSLTIQSEAPIGRGLGSSAAVIVGLLSGLFKQHKLAESKSTILEQAKQIESYQHGRSSGLDPATLIYGGLLKYQINQPIKPLHSQPLTGWLIDTGSPDSHTGECVQTVKKQHQNDSQLWQDFKNTSFEIEQAWSDQNINQLQQAIQQNHQLLCKIGVVPRKVQQFIQKLDQELNAASKVCGAGSILGDKAGMVLCLSEQSPETLCRQNGYPFWPLQLQPLGVQCELV